ncbi:hypothetical protein [Pandoraea sp. ISTKB]|uniref:hypothetical protein n=1 Tax=Pandoraea sp. ISTKB TaxID=1586708 RepID=UPI0008466781|nr:hypothetical protein [Pandoraea sp. ISTKB]ODP30921.1 hypothetical protein A9762_27510 [Pandoraea sp. ISTKB]
MSNWQEFVAKLTKFNMFDSARRSAIKEWGKDIPTTVLFGLLGKALAEHAGEFGIEDRVGIFQIIEDGVASEDAALKAYVSTGLLEAMYLRACVEPQSWTEIRASLGPLSDGYLTEWGNLPSRR